MQTDRRVAGSLILAFLFTATSSRTEAQQSDASAVGVPPASGDVVEIDDIKNPPPGVEAPVAITSHVFGRADMPSRAVLQQLLAHGRARDWHADVRYLVLEDGTVSDVQIIKTSGVSGLDTQFRTNVRKWRFKPATMSGRPIKVWIKTFLTFQTR